MSLTQEFEVLPDTELVDHVLNDMLHESGTITVYLDCGAVLTGTLSQCRRAPSAWILRSGQGANRKEMWFPSAHVQAVQKEA